MDGLMMDRPLLVKQIAERAESVFCDRELVARTQLGTERSTYGQIVERARRLAAALTELGIRPGDRVASFAWNSLRHLELYLAVPSMGAILHTINIRLFEEDLSYIVEHAGDRVIFLDSSLAGAMPRFGGVEREVLMPDGPGERPRPAATWTRRAILLSGTMPTGPRGAQRSPDTRERSGRGGS